MKRRDALKLSLLAGAGLAARGASAGGDCPTDGTPAQFIPKKPADLRPLESEFEKYPQCPYCGMDRRQFQHTRMLLHYGDDLADGTCSLRCAAVSLALNLDRDPKAIYVADNGTAGEPKPLIEAGQAHFLIGSDIKGVMTRRGKMAYGTAQAAQAARAAHGGELAGFDQALQAAYADMAGDVAMIRRNRAERRQRVAGGKQG